MSGAAAPAASPSRFSRAALLAAVAVNLGLTLYTGLVTLQDFPNSADEYSYYVSGLLFSEGRLSVPSPEPRNFFDFIHVVNDGRFFGKYTPGWPLLLALGIFVGLPWIIAPLLGAGTLLLTHRIAREQFSEEEANLSLAVLLGNPFLVFNAASYFSHIPCLFFVTAALWCYFRAVRRPAAPWAMAGMGLAAGLAFLVRPYSALAALLPPALLLLVRAVRVPPRRDRLRELANALIPFAACVILLLLYNRALTGDALRFTYSYYDGEQTRLHLGAEAGSYSWTAAGRINGYDRINALTRWVPLSGILVLVWILRPEARRDVGQRLLASSAAAVFLAYFLFFWPPGNEYGPRYIFELLTPLVLMMAATLRSFRRAGWALAGLIALLNLGVLVSESGRFSKQVAARRAIYEDVRAKKITHALVFLQRGAGDMPPGDLTRNGIHFDGDVLYVHDRGHNNQALLRLHPTRKAFVYTHNPKTFKTELIPLEGP